MKSKGCCFIGHRTISQKEVVKEKLNAVIERLINDNVTEFYFGSRSDFNGIALEVALQYKKQHPNIRLVYVRSEYPYTNEWYVNYLLETFDDTYMPSRVENAGKAKYSLRNQHMILQSDICVFYYDQNYKPPVRKTTKSTITYYQPKSGTKLSYEYAVKNKKEIINLFSY